MLRTSQIGLAVLLSGIAGSALAATGGQVSWREIDCDRSQLELFSWMQCRISVDSSVDKNLEGTARHYSTLGGTPDAQSGAVLSLPADNGYFTSYAPPESEQAIRSTVATSGRPVESWGPYQGFDRTGYMTFTSAGMNCVGYDHGGPYMRGGSGPVGYSFLLRGFFCERGPIADPKARLIDYLEATRVGPPSLARNAMGERVASLDLPSWRLAALPYSTTWIFPQPVVLTPGTTVIVGSTGATTVTPIGGTTVTTTTPAAPSVIASGGTSAAATGLSPMIGAERVIDAQLAWTGVAPQGTARIVPQQTGRTASLAFFMPSSSLSCTGTLIASAGAIGIAGPSQGTWSAACNNGETASGTYQADATGRGVGIGTDALGRSVHLSFGG